MLKYVDVSKYQGDIDFAKLAKEVDGVIIRAGYGKNNVDPYLIKNIKGCNDYNIPCGVYWFSYALTATDAALEASYCLAAIRPYKIELPICFDLEHDTIRYAKSKGVIINKQIASDMARAFCGTVEAAGYYAMNYANEEYYNNYFDADVLARFGLWYARYPSGNVDLNKRPHGCGIWQYSSTARVNGISGNVDINVAYMDFKTIIANAGLNNLSNSDAAAWYSEAQAWAIDKGITDGSRPTDAATRAEVWAMLHRLHGGV